MYREQEKEAVQDRRQEVAPPDVPSSGWSRIPALAKELDVPVSRLYEASRLGQLPGATKLGKYVLIDREVFFSALKRGDLAK